MNYKKFTLFFILITFNFVICSSQMECFGDVNVAERICKYDVNVAVRICEYFDEIDIEYEKTMIEKFKEAAQNVEWKGSLGLTYQGQFLGDPVCIDNRSEGKQKLIEFINSSFGFGKKLEGISFEGISQERFQSLSLALINFSISFFKEKDTDSCCHNEPILEHEEILNKEVRLASREFLCKLYFAEQACKTKTVENDKYELTPVPKH